MGLIPNELLNALRHLDGFTEATQDCLDTIADAVADLTQQLERDTGRTNGLLEEILAALKEKKR